MSVASEENTILDDVIELGTSLLIGYFISRFVRIALARGESMIPTISNNQTHSFGLSYVSSA